MSETSLGGMEGEVKEDHSMSPPDPLQINDPWKTSKKAVRQSKWEDLQLQADHPFVDKAESPLPFVQKLQETEQTRGAGCGSWFHGQFTVIKSMNENHWAF